MPRRTAPPSLARPLALGGAAAVLCAAALAGTAQADSIVFVKDANVWLANADGSGQYQVTTDGTADNPWQAPSQADDGTIVAVRAKPNLGPIVRMRQNGEVINEIPVFTMQYGPFNPAISPDGRLVAYEHVFRNTHETSNDVRVTSVDGLTHPDVYGHPGSGAGSPSWIDSGRILVGDYVSAQTWVPGQAPVEWWSDWEHQDQLGGSDDLDDGEVAPNGNVAFVRGDRPGNTIQLYRTANGTATRPVPTCRLQNPTAGALGDRFVDPTFSPSGDRLAWQEGDGIWAMTMPTGACETASPRLIIPGGAAPDWGPAAVNPGPRPEPRTDERTPGGTTPPPPRPDPVERRPAARGPGSASGCAALRGARRDACALRAALARCAAGPRGRKRSACVKRARRAAAIRACARRPRSGRARCVAAARRRFR